MPKSLYVDPDKMRAEGKITFKDIPINVYKKSVKEEVEAVSYTHLVESARTFGLEILPGVLTPTDVQMALNHGITRMKLFPADAFGEGYIKALKGPYPVSYTHLNTLISANFRKSQ